MDLGQPLGLEQQDDMRWKLEASGHTLQLQPGFRARYTIGARMSQIGGRTFEWWIEQLDAPAELAVHGGALFVAREVTNKTAMASAVHAKADASARIVGRAVGATGSLTGRSSPALLWRAIEITRSTCGLVD